MYERISMSVDAREDWQALNSEVVACRRCPRLVDWRERVAQEKRRAFHDWDYWGKPVPGFGDMDARLVIVGLAPAAHGANRTGRMFTGDSSGDTLAAAMHRAGFASRSTSAHRGDGLELYDAYLTAVARCAPPGNRPAKSELASCRQFLARELRLLHSARIVLALGHIAFNGYLSMLRDMDVVTSKLAFAHASWYTFEPPLPVLVACYHPSRQNTQTGRLTDEMLNTVFTQIRQFLTSDE
jgi:uracil-DNA glycosylase family 4